ncbi:MAG: class I fructose-bisphosphate aldolase [Jatrophihabitans sp.]
MDLSEIAAALLVPGKGILAADESVATMSSRLRAEGVVPTFDSRCAYRRLLLTTPRLSTWISGIIFSDETIGQDISDRRSFPSAAHELGILPGVKVDTGTTRMPFSGGGMVTQGLDDLRERLVAYRGDGAVFAKWRAVLDPNGLHRPTVHANAHALARYAGLCQEVGLVPVVEPEVLMTGEHSIALCQAVTANTLEAVFTELEGMGVDPSAVVLKPNMVVAGAGHTPRPSPAEVAHRTLRVLRERVPASVPGVAFLSGGQSNDEACANLAAITAEAAGATPWRLTFSFGRALVADALHTWAGERGNVDDAQDVLRDNCRRASAACAPATMSIPT